LQGTENVTFRRVFATLLQQKSSKYFVGGQVSFHAISLQCELKLYTTLQIYAIIIGLTRSAVDNPWPHLSSVQSWQKVTSVLRHRPCVWITFYGDVTTWLCIFLFNGIGKRIVDICYNVRFAHSSVLKICDMLTELQKVLSQELKYLFRKTNTVASEGNLLQITKVIPYIFIVL
jgi:hypothetical protein